ncbi:hypothetical protein BN1263180032 [Stenotrophomonas indicatrix]|nr:hypothetical protein BN1263180032 [Stenotrophomonas indicatrix]
MAIAIPHEYWLDTLIKLDRARKIHEERETAWLEIHLEQLGWWWWSGSSHYLSQCAVRAGSATRSAPQWLRHRPRRRFRRNPLVRR